MVSIDQDKGIGEQTESGASMTHGRYVDFDLCAFLSSWLSDACWAQVLNWLPYHGVLFKWIEMVRSPVAGLPLSNNCDQIRLSDVC